MANSKVKWHGEMNNNNNKRFSIPRNLGLGEINNDNCCISHPMYIIK